MIAPLVHAPPLIAYPCRRFFPDGSVLSLLANEELDPQHVIHHFKNSLRIKGLFIGTWALRGTTLSIDALAPLHGPPPSSSSSTSALTPTSPTALTAAQAENLKYVFRMTLSLRSRPLGTWNKLEWATYESVRVQDGECTPFSLKHEKPFWFSKVRSFGGY
jgi:F-box protein 9